MKSFLFIICLLLISFLQVKAQAASKIKKEADHLFEMAAYEKALDKYLLIKEKYSKNINFKYNLGRCYFHLNQLNEAISNLDFYRKNSPNPHFNIYYYLAKAHHLSNNFTEAAHYYKNHLKTLAKNAPERKDFKRRIAQCLIAPKVEQLNSGAVIATLGNKINSKSDDYRSCFNPRFPNQLFFSSTRNDSLVLSKKLSNKKINLEDSDIFKSKLIQGNWSEAEALSSRYNSKMTEELISFFDDGYQLIFLKGYPDGRKLLVKENYDEDSIAIVLPFILETNSNYIDTDHFFITDSVLIFSSNRPGGYGGYDLYYMIQQADKSWTSAVNLGPIINGKYDEISPFLTKDGRTLYFSSNNTKSMGGFDIFKAIFEESNSTWDNPQNMGTPINSAADEKDFILDKNGLKSYFSSNRIESFGGYDLFSGYFRTPIKEQLVDKKSSSFVDILIKTTSINKDNISQNSSKKTPSIEPLSTNLEDETIYNIAPIYYDAQTGKTEGSRNTINNLVKLLVRHPTLVVVLSSHADNSGNAISNLFLTVKQAEELGKDLIKNGVLNEQIWIRGCSQNYPIANNKNFDGSPNIIANTMNRRINTSIYNIIDSNKIKVNIIEPEVSPIMKNTAYDTYQNKIKGLSYKVELVATPTMLNHTILGEFSDATTEKRPLDININYLIGLENNFKAIKKIYDNIIQKGFPQAKIIPYINGIRLEKKELQAQLQSYSDLTFYLDFISNE